jgi:hypothetical protein
LTINSLSEAFVEYNNNAAKIDQDEQDDNDDGDLLFSLKPPGANSAANSQSSDPLHLEKLWTWLVDHPDITVRQTPSSTALDAFNPLHLVLAAHANERLYTTEQRIWHALTDHDIDLKRIPKLEFQCLQVIAAAGSQGVLQPDVTRLTGQDKRSVPKRTDSLASKGYITKEMCLGGGIKTSLLRLKKLTQGASSTYYVVKGEAGKGQGSTRRMINYEQWFTEAMLTLKKHEGLIAYEDLRKEMGIHGMRWETRALHRCNKRLEKAGCVQRQPPEHQYEINSDAPTEKNDAEKTEHDPDNVYWVRCVKLMREPNDKDKDAFVSSRTGKSDKTADDSDAEADADADEDDDYVEVDAAALGKMGKMAESMKRVPPQWRPEMHHTQFFFQIVKSAGTKGISTMDLADQGLGRFWRRPLDEVMGRLTDVWTASQPLHLRHLAIVRDTSQLHRISHYVFRSFGNFQKLVDRGEAAWEAIDIKPAEILKKPDLDAWGFVKVKPSTIVGHDGIYNVTACKNVLIKSKTKSKRPRWETKAFDVKRTPNKPTLVSSAGSTPLPSVEQEDRASKSKQKKALKGPKIMFLMNPKRVEAEVNEWKARSRKLAVFKAREELGLSVSVISGPKPTKRRKLTPKTANTGTIVSQASEHEPTVSMPIAREQSAQHSEGTRPLSQPDAQDPKDSDTKDTEVPTPPTNPELDQRAAELEEEICTMAKPGIYINPPGSGQAKNDIVQPKGRPSRYLIAVFKSEKLKALPWFKEKDSYRPSSPQSLTITPEPSLDYSQPGTPVSAIEQIQIPQEDITPTWTTMNPDSPAPFEPEEVKEEIVIKRGRRIQVQRQGKRKAYEPLRQRVTKKLAVSTEDGKWRPVNQLEKAYRMSNEGLAMTMSTPMKRAVPIQEIQETPSSAVSRMLFNTGDESQAASSAMDIDVEMTVPTEDERQQEASLADAAHISNAQSKQDSIQLPPVAEVVRKVHSTHTQSDKILEPFFRRALRRPSVSGLDDDADFAENSTSIDDSTATPVRTRVRAQAKVGVGRAGGIVSFNRNRVVLEIIRHNGGFFGGERELYYPFVTVWDREFQRRPDRYTLDRVIATLLDEGRLKKDAFSFATEDGKLINKTIIMEPHIDPSCKEVQDLKQKIISAHPLTYIPETTDLLPELRLRLENDVRGGVKSAPETLNPNDFFLDDPTVTVSRIPGPQKVQLGMTEARMQKGVSVRRRRREEDERREQRYIQAQVEEDIDNAVAALTSDFQLDSYQHDPTGVVIDRGPRGRSRLAKLQRWGAEDQHIPRRALGLLTANGQNPEKEAEQNSRDAVAAADFGILRPIEQVPQPVEDLPEPPRVHFALPPEPAEPSLAQMLHQQKHTGTFNVIEALSMSSPYQRFHRQSGTFSTDPVVITTSSEIAKYGFMGQQMQIPKSLADIFKQAGEEAELLEVPKQSPNVGYEVPRFAAVGVTRLPRLHSARPRPAPRPQPEYRSYGAKAILPRSSRTGIFSMSEKEEQRLIYAVVIVKTLTGGLEQIVTWGLVHQVFHYKFDPNYCRHRWVFLRTKLGGTADKLQVEFQKLFLEAYASGEVPGIDFVEPEKYDWLSIVEWAESRLSRANPLNGLPDLPKSRTTLDSRFDVKTAAQVYNVPREDFWVANVTHLRREELVNSWSFIVPLAKAPKAAPKDEELMLALSWVRANVVTPDSVYDSNKAHEKLSMVEDDLPRALENLLGAKIIRMENKGRQIPGRNYDISDQVLTMFKRQWDVRYLKQTAAYKKEIDRAFAEDGKLAISYQATDPEMTAMTNLVAAGRATVVVLLPETNHTFDAPLPRLSKWGFTEGNYKTVHMDKSRLQFDLELHPSDKYIAGMPILPMPAPPLSKQFAGEIGPRLPLWTDIHGNLIQVYWDMTVMATLWLLCFRAGLKVGDMSKGAYKGKLWTWELEMFLEWAEGAGLAKRMNDVDGVGEVGWTVSEWWWLAFAVE